MPYKILIIVSLFLKLISTLDSATRCHAMFRAFKSRIWPVSYLVQLCIMQCFVHISRFWLGLALITKLMSSTTYITSSPPNVFVKQENGNHDEIIISAKLPVEVIIWTTCKLNRLYIVLALIIISQFCVIEGF